MLERFKRQLQRETPVSVHAGHVTTFTVGCETCPNKREVCVRYIGKAALDPGTMPLGVAIDVELKLSIGEKVIQNTERVSEFTVNNGSCDDVPLCSYEDAITRYYDALAGDPSLLNAQLGIFPDEENHPH